MTILKCFDARRSAHSGRAVCTALEATGPVRAIRTGSTTAGRMKSFWRGDYRRFFETSKRSAFGQPGDLKDVCVTKGRELAAYKRLEVGVEGD